MVIRKKKSPPYSDLHGYAPQQSPWALLIIDMITDLKGVDEAETLAREGLRAAHNILKLKKLAKTHSVPVIYANDNFGLWQSDFRNLLSHVLNTDCLGRPIAEILKPEEDDYFVLKPKHSAFFSTTLDTLLRYLGTTTVILTGMTANQCVLFTANDAHMRDFEIYIPSNCIAGRNAKELEAAFLHFETILCANTASDGVQF